MIELMFIFQVKHSSDGGSSAVFSARGKKLGNLNGIHWRSSHYAITLMRNKKKVTFKGGHLHVMWEK